MTGRWEARLHRIQRGDDDLDSFMSDVEDYVRNVIQTIFQENRKFENGA
jgi:DNA topoisomerase-3